MCSNSEDAPIDPNSSEKTYFEKRFHRLADSDSNSDCKFLVGPGKSVIYGHKVMFCAASDVFGAMFYGELKEDGPVKVEDLKPDGFEGMKTYIYTGEISFKSAFHALSTYIAARKYLIPQLCNECTNFIEEKIKPSEVLEFCDLCRINSITDFEELCSQIIQEKTDEVVASQYFVFAESDTIELILKSPSLKLESEIEVFEHFERWALAQVEQEQIHANDIASSFNDLKRHIRFLTISGEEFVSRAGKSVLLTQEEKEAIAFNQIKPDSKTMPESLTDSQQPRNFKPSQSNYYQYTHKFVISIADSNSSSNSYTIIDDRASDICTLKVLWFHFDGLISFRLDTSYTNMKALLNIKTKFKVLAVKECDNLVFENECKDIVSNINTRAAEQHQMVLAVIPMSELKNEHFMSTTDKKEVNIVGSFKVKRINL